MMKIVGAIFGCLLSCAAVAQTIQSGGGSVNSGVTPIFGCSTGQLLFSTGSVVSCSTITTASTNVNFIINGSSQADYGITHIGNWTFSSTTDFGGSIEIGRNGPIGDQTIGSSTTLGWSSNIHPNGQVNDTGISRHTTAGVIDIGSGSAQSTAGGLQTGNATLLSLTTGTNADFLCLNAGGGILIQTTACTISSLRFKPDWKRYDGNALRKISKLDVGTFHTNTGPNADPNAFSLQAGLNAEDVARIAPECAVYENDMKTPKSYRQECVIALLVKAIQQLQQK